jgi:hypothetical protein
MMNWCLLRKGSGEQAGNVRVWMIGKGRCKKHPAEKPFAG